MKILLVTILLVSTLSVKLNLSSNTVLKDLNKYFTLSSCQGLPQGIVLNGNQHTYGESTALQDNFL